MEGEAESIPYFMLDKEYIDWANADNLDALSSSRFKKIIDEIYKRRGIERKIVGRFRDFCICQTV